MRIKSFKQLSLILVLILLISLLPLSSFASGGSFTSSTYNGRTYKIFVPNSYQAGQDVPLMVMLHGCTQDPDQFSTGTRMNELAGQENFIVIYPLQTSTANSSKCWNWFETAHQHRGSGEPALIAGMVNQVKGSYSIDNSRVFVAGLSAGGAMSVIMGATYPDVFSGIGVGAGLEYKAATSMVAAFTAMSSGGPSPNTQGDLAYNEMTKSAPRVMPTIVFHGTSDSTVAPVNAHQVLSQWARTNDRADDGQVNGSINDTANLTEQGQVPGGRAFTRYAYNDSLGNIVMEKYMVTGMGHAWSGGNSAGSYTDPNGPNATQIMWNFFMNSGGEPEDPTEPPVTRISPNGGEFIGSETVTISATNSPDTIYYSYNGTNYSVYTSALTITENTTVYAKAENENGMSEVVSATFTKGTAPAYETVNATANEHYLAGRLDVNGYLAMGAKYGYLTPFNLYRVIGTSVWTDIEPDGGLQNPDPIVVPVTSISPNGGTFTDSIAVTLSGTNNPDTIYYSFNGVDYSVYTSPLTITETTTVYAKAENEGGMGSVVNATFTKQGTQSVSMAISNVSTKDGYVKANNDGSSPVVGTYSNLAVGAGSDSKQNRVILHFDTSVIPNDATITKAYITVEYNSGMGDPWTGGSMVVDVKSGFFGVSDSVQTDDWSAIATASSVAQISKFTSGTRNCSDFNSAGISAINKTGITQLRLRFNWNPSAYNYIFIKNGASAKLYVEYE